MANRTEINKSVIAILKLLNIYFQHLKIKDVLFTESKSKIMLALENEIGVSYNLTNGALEVIDVKLGKLTTNLVMCNSRFDENQFRKYIIKLFSKKVKGGFNYYKELHEDLVKFNPDIEYINELNEKEVAKLLSLTQKEKLISYVASDIRNGSVKGGLPFYHNRQDNLLYSVSGNSTNKIYGGAYRYIFNFGHSYKQTFNLKNCEWIERLFEKYYLYGGMKDLWNTFQIVKTLLEKEEQWEKANLHYNCLELKNIDHYEPFVKDTFLNYIDGYLPLSREIITLDPITVSFTVREKNFRWWI